MKDLFTKHIDTVVILGGIIGTFIWLNGSLNEMQKNIHAIDVRLTKVEMRLEFLERTLISKGLIKEQTTTTSL